LTVGYACPVRTVDLLFVDNADRGQV